jgi:hypothetical protein
VSCRERKKVEILFAHLKRILRLDRLRLRRPSGAKDEFLLAATAQNLRKLAKLIPLPTPVFATSGEGLKSAALIAVATAVRSRRSRGSSTQFAHSGRLESTSNRAIRSLCGPRDPQLAQVDATGLGAHSSQFIPPFLSSRRGDEPVARGSRRPLKLRKKSLRVVVSTR